MSAFPLLLFATIFLAIACHELARHHWRRGERIIAVNCLGAGFVAFLTAVWAISRLP